MGEGRAGFQTGEAEDGPLLRPRDKRVRETAGGTALTARRKKGRTERREREDGEREREREGMEMKQERKGWQESEGEKEAE